MQIKYSVETIHNFRQLGNPKAWVSQQEGGRFSERFKGMVRQVAQQTNVPAALEFANTVLNGHGIEYVSDPRDQVDFRRAHGISYVNMGDVYNMTVLYDHGAHRFRWSTLGVLLEQQRQRFKS